MIDPNSAQIAVVPLRAYASQEMPGMSAATDVIAANFQQGQIMEQQFQMTTGKCYGAVAVGPGISTIEIKFVAVGPVPIPGMSGALAQNQGQGPNVSLGGRGNCYKPGGGLPSVVPVAMTAKAVYTAIAGSGVAAGQVFVK